MTMRTRDFAGQIRQGKKKYRGEIRITNEMMEQILGLPDDVELIDTWSDHREVIHFRLRSDKEKKGVFDTGEGMECACTADIELMLAKRAIELAKHLATAVEGTKEHDLYKRAIESLSKEEV